MGLDMYLYGRRYLSGYTHCKPEQQEAFAKLTELAGVPVCDASPHAYVEVAVCYWRKANAVHKWFVDNTQGGEDECGYSDVSREELKTLRDLCAGILAEHTEEAAKRLPPSPGFFFGSDEIDERYWRDLADTVEQIDKALAMHSDIDFVYHASW